jgi:hypothetical protein
MPQAKSSAELPRAARCALERAQQLSDSRPEARDTRWYQEALHVGDLTVLVALALRK